MGIEMIIGLATALLAVIAGTFGLGHARGTNKAEAKADQQRTEENAAATVAAAERRADATKGASDVEESVKRMGDDDVDRELRERFTRPGGGRYRVQLGADHLPDRPRYRRAGHADEARHSGAQHIGAGQLPAINRKGYEMSEAKPQDGSTVKATAH